MFKLTEFVLLTSSVNDFFKLKFDKIGSHFVNAEIEPCASPEICWPLSILKTSTPSKNFSLNRKIGPGKPKSEKRF